MCIYIYIYIQDLHLVITVSADALAPKASRRSAGAVLTTKLDIILFYPYHGSDNGWLPGRHLAII